MATTKLREVNQRWTRELVKNGWTPISDFFLDNYWKLNPPIKGAEVLLIVHLLRYKWDQNAPFPAFKTIAKKMGVSSTAVRNHARSLEAKRYLQREMQVGSTNRFDLNPLFKALEKLQLVQEQQRIDAEIDKLLNVNGSTTS
jgi:DnaD-like protein